MGYLNEKILQLERQIQILNDKINTIETDSQEANTPNPYTVVGGNKDKVLSFPVDIKTNLGGTYGSFLPWNDAELVLPPYGIKPIITPTKGYHKHSHSRYAGGALDINTLELVEYDIDWETDENYSKHSQQFWFANPPIAKTDDGTPKIGLLDIEFDEESKTWLTGSKTIDVEKTFLVKKDKDGNIELDSKENEKKSSLYNEDETKSSVVWDEIGKVWRFYAVYAEDPENQEE